MNKLLTVLMFVLIAVPGFSQIGLEGVTLPQANELRYRPYVQYKNPGQAEVIWETKVPCETVLHYGKQGQDKQQIKDASPKTRHKVTLNSLEMQTIYEYKITTQLEGLSTQSPVYHLDTTFNYSPAPIPKNASPFNSSSEVKQRAKELLEKSGEYQGFAIVFNCGEGALAFELAKQSRLTVYGLDTDESAIQAGRKKLYDAGLYGTRVILKHVDELSTSEMTSYYANLVVGDLAPSNEVLAEMKRVLRPRNTMYYKRSDDVLEEYTAPTLPGSGQWTHQYGNAANNANSGDTLKGAGKTGEMMVQWVGRPGADFGIDRNPRMPAPLSSNGRLFHQGLNRMCGLDMYNGSMYWMLEVPGLRRVNIPRDASNWCVDDDTLFVAVEDHCWKVDAVTGEVKTVLPLPDESQHRTHGWGYIAQEGDIFFGSSVKHGSSYTDFWAKTSWYDGTSGAGTWKVCSDSLFAIDKSDNQHKWSYENGRIINPAIGVADALIVFAENRNEKVLEAPNGRIELDELWQDQYLVALNVETGEKVWEHAIDVPAGIVVYFLIIEDGTIMISSSENEKYHIHAFDLKTGEAKWNVTHPWPTNHHGGHMQHPAVSGGKVFLEPRGYHIATGELATDKMGIREGCATVSATSDALIFRGTSRRVSMWDIEEEKVSSWLNLRPSCWLSVVPSGGMILAPEGGGGCSCGTWVETSLGFIPVPILVSSN